MKQHSAHLWGYWVVLLIALSSTQCTQRSENAQTQAVAQDETTDGVKVMTFNIRYDNPSDGDNQWSNRTTFVADVIHNSAASIVGIQEGLHHQVATLDSLLPSYSYVGVGRDDGATEGEYTAIYVDTTQFEIIEEATFWLSESPDRPSVGWDASMERIATYAILFPRPSSSLPSTPFLVVNAHFDHRGELSRTQSAFLIQAKVEELRHFGAMESIPALVMGDFNASPSSDAIEVFRSFLNDSYHATMSPPIGPVATYNGFKVQPGGYQDPDGRIDYIFTSDEFSVQTYAAIDEIRDGRYVSDHFPILVGVRLGF